MLAAAGADPACELKAARANVKEILGRRRDEMNRLVEVLLAAPSGRISGDEIETLVNYAPA